MPCRRSSPLAVSELSHVYERRPQTSLGILRRQGYEVARSLHHQGYERAGIVHLGRDRGGGDLLAAAFADKKVHGHGSEQEGDAGAHGQRQEWVVELEQPLTSFHDINPIGTASKLHCERQEMDLSLKMNAIIQDE